MQARRPPDDARCLRGWRVGVSEQR
jgi:hypothetical protein